MNMPESIINGGSGANHWAARQANLNEKVEAKEKKEEESGEDIKPPAVLNDAEKAAGIKSEKEVKEEVAKEETKE